MKKKDNGEERNKEEEIGKVKYYKYIFNSTFKKSIWIYLSSV